MCAKKTSRADDLRKRAADLMQKSPEAYQPGGLNDVSALAQELAIHQIELELQNEELQNTQVTLQEARDRFTELYEHAPVGYVVLDSAGIIRQANQTWYTMINQPDADLRGKPFTGTLVEEDAPVFLGRFRAFFKDPAEKQIVIRMQRRNSTPFHARIEARPHIMKETRKQGQQSPPEELMVTISDISDLQEAHRQIEEQNAALQEANAREKRLNAILGAIRNVNQLITKEEDTEKLIHDACRTLTEGLSYHNAWVALLDETGKVTTTASSGFDGGFRALRKQLGQGDFPPCMQKALAGSQVVVIHAPETHCKDCPIAPEYDNHSSLARRLKFGNRIYGILAVSVPDQYADSREEQELFIEVSDDLAFALDKLELVRLARQDHERLQFVIEGADQGTWEWNIQTNETIFNHTWAEMLGYTIDELTPYSFETWVQLTHPDDLEIAMERLNRCVSGETPDYDCALRMKHKQGHWVWILDRGKVMTRDADGKPLLMFGTHTDISRHKKMEDELRETSQSLQAILDFSPLLINEISIDGRYLSVNQATANFLELSPSELVGKPFGELLPAATAEKFMERIQRVVEGRQPIYVEDHLDSPDGGREYLSTIYPLFDSSGEIRSIGSIAHDITDRKRAEKAIEESEEKYRLLAETTQDIILLHDMQGRIVYVNQAGLDLTGFTSSEALGKPVSSFIPPEHLAEITARQKQRLQGDSQVLRYETTFTDKHGNSVPVEVHSSVILREGKAAQILAVARDITDRKRAEEEIRQHAARLAAMVDILQYRSEDLQEFLDHALAKALELTGSKLGYIYFYDEDRREFELNTWSKDVMPECAVIDPQTCYQLDKTGMWGEAVRQRKPILLNDFKAGHPLKKGYPEGHVNLERFLTVPVLYQDRIVAVVGVANKPQDYDETDTLQLTLLMDSVWKSVETMQAEAALRARERYLHTILQTTVDGFWVINTEGRLLEVNPAYCEMSGYSRDELLQLSIAELNVEEKSAQTEERIKRIIQNGAEVFETRHRRKDGSLWDVEVSATWMDENGGRFICFCRDLTERKQRDEHIALLGHMLDDAPAAITIHNTAGEFVFANQHTIELHGYDSPEEFMAINLHDLDVPESEKLLEERFRQIAQGGSARFEAAHYRKDGSTFPLEVQAKAIEWNGEPAVLSIASDISERKRMEKENNLLADLIKRSQDFIGVADTNQNAFFVNPAGQAMIGLEGDDAVRNATISDFFCEEDLPFVSETILPSVLENGRWAGEFRFRHFKTGEPINVLYDVFLTGDPDTDEAVNISTVTRDITERKQAEQALIESEERFRSYIEHSPIGVYISDKAGNLIDVNQAACADTGYSRNELLQMNFIDLHPPERQEAAVSQFQSIFTEKKLSAEIPFLRKDGSQGTWALNAIFLPDQQVMGFAADITEQKSLEDQLMQSQKMETVGGLAGGGAHDFNNMLSVIMGHLEMALDELDPAEIMYSDLQEAYKSAERSADLTAQLLAFARKQTVAPVPLNLNDTIAGMLKMLERLIGEDIDLLWKPGTDLAPVKMDPSQIDQMLANLCINARDAIRNTGKITIETGNVSFDEAYCASHADFFPGSYVMLAVSDDGCGMDKEIFSHLFEPFFTTKSVGQGTGLGLATVYGIVKQNNGFINVYSEPGEGTTFRIYLPEINVQPDAEHPAGPSQSSAAGEETILLVEDEPAILKVTTMMLERMGYTVLPASSPVEGIRLAKEFAGEIDLLITDVIMPEMNGRDLAHELLSHYPQLKRLFMSGYTANTIAHHGVLDPGVEFIQKPFSIQDLSTRVREVLNRP